MTLKLPEDLRVRLKEPLGNFVSNLESLRDKSLVCVGDQASRDIIKAGLNPRLCVYDSKIQRQEIDVAPEILSYDAVELRVKNMQGTLSREVFDAVEKALNSGEPHKLFIEGEEDLVTLVAIKLAPVGWVVLYGQPNEGLVQVLVNEEVKSKVNSMLSEMEDGC